MSPKKDLAIDLDSIVVAIDNAWYGEYNRRYDDHLATENITDWNLHQFCRKDLAGVDHPVHAVYGIIAEPGFFQKPLPLPGAVEGVKRLVDAGHNVLLVSAGDGNALSDKYFWVKKYLPFFDVRKKLILTYEKRVVKADVLFDDGPHNIESYRKEWPDSRIATICYPYNKDARGMCDLIAGHFRKTEEAWETFTKWVEDGCPRIDRTVPCGAGQYSMMLDAARFPKKHNHADATFYGGCPGCQDECATKEP